jgi:threonine/homoserine/homoserine lactone efflux protein
MIFKIDRLSPQPEKWTNHNLVFHHNLSKESFCVSRPNSCKDFVSLRHSHLLIHQNLTFLALQTLWSLRNEFGKFDYEGTAKTGVGAAFRLGLITNLTNVKAAVFAVAFIPQFVPKDFNLGWGIFLLSIVQALTSASWYAFLISMIGRATTVLARPKVRRGLTAFSALGILFLAATLLLTSPR